MGLHLAVCVEHHDQHLLARRHDARLRVLGRCFSLIALDVRVYVENLGSAATGAAPPPARTVSAFHQILTRHDTDQDELLLSSRLPSNRRTGPCPVLPGWFETDATYWLLLVHART